MNKIIDLLFYVFFGDFGLLTTTPKYLFLILFPIMTALGVVGRILPLIPALRRKLSEGSSLLNEFFFCFIGLGCTTAALASLNNINNSSAKKRLAWILVLIVPCSSQMAIMATFATLVTARVFLAYIAIVLLFIALIYVAVSAVYSPQLPPPGFISCEKALSVKDFSAVIKDAFLSVLESAPSFCIGSLIISLALYFGLMDTICRLFAPCIDDFLGLPKEAVSLLIFNVLKRDFGSASLLSIGTGGAFDGIQIVVLMVMMTFSLPCFNSTVLLFKEEGLRSALAILLGSLVISIISGKLAFTLLSLLFG